jgi:glutamine amidotransferase
MIALLDYGAGNLTSVKKALGAIGAVWFVPETPATLSRARGMIVPGVGHFGATRALDESWRSAILDGVASGQPLLGICLGMQWLFDGSEEAPDCPGLSLLAGECRRLVTRPSIDGRLKVPHVGWNALARRRNARVMEGVPEGAQVYFTHSYAAPISEDTVAATEHGETFAAVVERDRIAGVQFHPEKSGEVGLRILTNWLRLVTDYTRDH